jgi:hypothetical protein
MIPIGVRNPVTADHIDNIIYSYPIVVDIELIQRAIVIPKRFSYTGYIMLRCRKRVRKEQSVGHRVVVRRGCEVIDEERAKSHRCRSSATIYTYTHTHTHTHVYTIIAYTKRSP